MTADWVDAWVIQIRAGSTRKRLTDSIVPPILRSYFATHDQDFRITRDGNGRPICPEIDLNFNLAYSDSTAVVVVGQRAKLGLDVERIQFEATDLDELVHEHFCVHEARFYFATKPSQRARVFFHIWTQKEAVTKAIGLGLKQPLQDLAVEPDPDRGCRLIALNGQSGDGWTLRALHIGDDHNAVIASFGSAYLVNHRGEELSIESTHENFAV